MSRHHWMYFGCQCSSARCSRLLLDRFTLLGIFSAEIISWPRSSTQRTHKGEQQRDLDSTFVSLVSFVLKTSGALPIELRPTLLSVDLQRAFFADGVRPLEDPVLPGRQPAEDLGLHRLGSGEAEIGFEAGHRVRRE